MFGKLKDKLKDALSVFSKKTQEEAQVEEKVVEIEVKQQSLSSPQATKQEKKPEPQIVKTIKEEFKKEEIQKQRQTFQEKIEREKRITTYVSINQEKKDLQRKQEQAQPQEQQTPNDNSQKEIKEQKEEYTQPPSPEKKGFFTNLFKKKEEAKEPVPEQELVEEKPTPKKEEKKREEPTEEPKREVVRSQVPPEEKKGFFEKVKQTLTTRTLSSEKFEELFWDLELVLLENNVSVEVIEKIKEDLKQELVDKPLPWDLSKKIEETLQTTLKTILSCKPIDLLELTKTKKPYVIAFFGINGTGKTTSIAKLTHYFQSHNKTVVLAACDTFRAAAIQQLEEHANRLNVKIIKHDYGSDAAAVAYDAIKYAKKNNIDIVLIDTAGRLHSNTNLMAELEKIIRVTKPDLKIFVGESITGNDCIEQAREFNKLVEMDGAILTKADVDEKGGAPLSISYTIKKPILFLGVGQEYKDLEPFEADVILKRLGF